jgi:hypothetical protein
MVAVVNGYVCFSSCDADKAKQGKDPNAPPGAENDPSKAHDPSKPKSVFDSQPATVFGGALQDLANAVNPSGDAASTGGDYQSSAKIDRLA